MINLGKVNGKLYGLPVNASLPIMYFNTELVRKAGGDPQHMPDTWEGSLRSPRRSARPPRRGWDRTMTLTIGLTTGCSGAMIHQSGGKMLDPSEPRRASMASPAKRQWSTCAAL